MIFSNPSTAAPPKQDQSPASLGESLEASEDLLFDFFDFFDRTVDDLYSYVLHRVHSEDIAVDTTLNVYYSLLQRKRFFWWRNIAQLSTLMSLADKEVSALRKWDENSMGDDYLQELEKCYPDNEDGTVDRLRLILKSFKKLSTKEQRMAIVRFFLQWPAKKTAAAMERKMQYIEKEYEAMLHQIIEELKDEELFSDRSIEKFLERISCPKVSEDSKAAWRVALLEKYREAKMSNVKYVMPVAGASALVGCFVIFSTFFVKPVTGLPAIQQVAAMEVLITENQINYRDQFLEAEKELKGVSAHYAKEELAEISIGLASYALEKQVNLENDTNNLLKKLRGDTMAFISNLFANR